MMKYKNILFDLDGTLTDPKEGITKSVAHALKHFGIEPPPLDELCPFIGPPLSESFVKYYGFSQEKSVEAVKVYREYFAPKGKFENKVYPGIADMLKKLKEDGRVIALATSKPETFSTEILEHFDLAKYFDIIRGSMLDGRRVHKSDVIRSVLVELGDDETVMVGDRCFDVQGAHECGIPCIGVLYGYGGEGELKSAGADAIACTVEDLCWLLLSD